MNGEKLLPEPTVLKKWACASNDCDAQQVFGVCLNLCFHWDHVCVFSLSLSLAEEMDSNLSVLNLEPGDALPDHSTSADMVSVPH